MSRRFWCICSFVHPSSYWVLTLVLGWLGAACTTTEGESKTRNVVRTHYTLHAGEKKVHPAPLPAETPISVDWHKSDGSSSRIKGFKGYDFDGDGRFEMVEVLKEDGTIQSYVYDFDHDGRVDQMTPNGEIESQQLAVPEPEVPVAPIDVAGPMPTPPEKSAEQEQSPVLVPSSPAAESDNAPQVESIGGAANDDLAPFDDLPKSKASVPEPLPQVQPEELEPIATSGSKPAS